jgi:alkylation response protein AidB-like acyl-CoA dehydrogenase
MGPGLPYTQLAELEAWLNLHWSQVATIGEWWSALSARGLSQPELPEPWGRGWTPQETKAYLELLLARGLPCPPWSLGNYLVIPTLLEHGSERLVERFVPRILDGSHGWCQLFSEPNAGSDLASLRTIAKREGDEWFVTGQKVWTSNAAFADYSILIARTNTAVPATAGITFFVLAMRQEGVQVRPLREMTGESVFSEVFLDNARIPADHVVGEVNGGWAIAKATLRHERRGIGTGATERISSLRPGTVAGDLCCPAVASPGTGPIEMPKRLDLETLMAFARRSGRNVDPVVRQRLARLYSEVRISEWSAARAKLGSPGLGIEGNLAKLRHTAVTRQMSRIASAVLGPAASLYGPDAESGGVAQRHIVFTPAVSIYGGTDQIQRTIISERGLGLPREPDYPQTEPGVGYGGISTGRSRTSGLGSNV